MYSVEFQTGPLCPRIQDFSFCSVRYSFVSFHRIAAIFPANTICPTRQAPRRVTDHRDRGSMRRYHYSGMMRTRSSSLELTISPEKRPLFTFGADRLLLCELAFVHGRRHFQFPRSIWHHPFDPSMVSILDCVCLCGVKYDHRVNL